MKFPMLCSRVLVWNVKFHSMNASVDRFFLAPSIDYRGKNVYSVEEGVKC